MGHSVTPSLKTGYSESPTESSNNTMSSFHVIPGNDYFLLSFIAVHLNNDFTVDELPVDLKNLTTTLTSGDVAPGIDALDATERGLPVDLENITSLASSGDVIPETNALMLWLGPFPVLWIVGLVCTLIVICTGVICVIKKSRKRSKHNSAAELEEGHYE